MTRQELIAELERLIEATRYDEATQCTAAILSSLQGAILSSTDEQLMRLCAAFSEGEIRKLNARMN